MNDLDPQVPTPFTNKLWGCLLVNDRSVARYLVKIVKDAGRNDPDLSHICAQALCQITRMETSEETSQLMTEERKKQEEALHKFRTREANLLIAQVNPHNFFYHRMTFFSRQRQKHQMKRVSIFPDAT